jgi:hypothetical protein
MRLLCEENGVEFILIKAPSLYPYWYEEYDAQMQAYARQHGLSYYNLTQQIDEIGLDFSVDTYDSGLHLNLTGTNKLSKYFAKILVADHGVPDHRNDPEIAAVYEEKLLRYDAEAQKESE